VNEALHPNQQKLDVHEPHKNKLTAQDFAKLRSMSKKKPIKEEEQLDELELARTKAKKGTVVKMKRTGVPDREGSSFEVRQGKRKLAKGYYDRDSGVFGVNSKKSGAGGKAYDTSKDVVKSVAKNIKEETRLDELSKGTLGRYIKKAKEDVRDRDRENSYTAAELGHGSRATAALKIPRAKAHKRSKNIDKAVDKLTKEETQLDELSAEKLVRYIKKAQANKETATNDYNDGVRKFDINHPSQKSDRKKIKKRTDGIRRATNRLVRHPNPDFRYAWLKHGTHSYGLEEQKTNLDELSKGTLGRYIKKAKDNAIVGAVRQVHMDYNPAKSSYNKYHKTKSDKRLAGIDKAVDKLTKEETQLDELSKKKISDYISKNFKDTHNYHDDTEENNRKVHNRSKGLERALDKRDGNSKKKVLTKESQLDEKCWKGYEMFGTKNKNGKKVPNCVPVEESDNNKSIESAKVPGKGTSTRDVKYYLTHENIGNHDGNVGGSSYYVLHKPKDTVKDLKAAGWNHKPGGRDESDEYKHPDGHTTIRHRSGSNELKATYKGTKKSPKPKPYMAYDESVDYNTKETKKTFSNVKPFTKDGNPDWAKHGIDPKTITHNNYWKKVGDLKNSARNEETQLDEVTPSGAKYERMVKHIKKKYAKDGLTKQEKSIAYATAWKAKNREELREAMKEMRESIIAELRKNLGEDAVNNLLELSMNDAGINSDDYQIRAKPVVKQETPPPASRNTNAGPGAEKLNNMPTMPEPPAPVAPVRPEPKDPEGAITPAPGQRGNSPAPVATPAPVAAPPAAKMPAPPAPLKPPTSQDIARQSLRAPVAAARNDGKTGTALAQSGVSRQDRLNQDFVSRTLGPGAPKAGSAQANLALKRHFDGLKSAAGRTSGLNESMEHTIRNMLESKKD
jgi:hypothetical protein